MAGAQNTITIEIEDAELRAALQRLQARLGDLKPFFNDVGETLLNSTRARFQSQTAPDGSPWAALSPAYRARKPRNKSKILTLWGRLRGTLTKQADQNSLRIGTPLNYGATHQFGAAKGSFGDVTAHIKAHTRRGRGGHTIPVRAHTRKLTVPWGDIPARPFLGLSSADRADLLAALNAYLAPGG